MRQMPYLILVVLIALIGGGWYSLGQKNAQIDEDLETALTSARAAAERGVTNEVIDGYGQALKIRKDPAIAAELADYMSGEDDPEAYVEVLEELLSQFPQEAFVYEQLVRALIGTEEFAAAYATIEAAERREVTSDGLSAVTAEIRYAHEVGTSGFADVRADANGYARVAVGDGWRLFGPDGNVASGVYEQISAAGDDGFYGVRDVAGPRLVNLRDEKDELRARKLDFVEYGGLSDNRFVARTADGRAVYLNRSFVAQHSGTVYADATAYSEGIAAVLRDSGRWDVIDVDGAVVLGDLDSVVVSPSGSIAGEGRFFATKGGSLRMYDLKGVAVGDLVLEDARTFRNGPAAAKSDGRWGFVAVDGSWAQEPRWDDAKSFDFGLAPVNVGGLWGFADETGAVVVPTQFADAVQISERGTGYVRLVPPAGALESSPQVTAPWAALTMLRLKE